MLGLHDLTVGQVSGMIAAAVFIVQFLVPILLPIVLLGLLRPASPAVTETAVSWSVVGRYLHGSLWPLFLRTDSASTLASCKRVMFISFFKKFMLMLLAVTAIVTPLGLHEGIVADPAKENVAFHYVRDTTPMGYGTSPRIETSWSRVCGAFDVLPCVNDDNEASTSRNSTTIQVNFTKNWYDSRISQQVVDVFQSGVPDLGATFSGPFDIQFRSYVESVVDDLNRTMSSGPLIDNGTVRTVGIYQPLSSLVLSDDLLAVEGLIVDMKNGGIGFRNHSAPSFSPFGSAWSEDLLFIVPETVCVDTNLTFDFQVARTRSEEDLARGRMFKPEIVDHGGFVNLNTTPPMLEDKDVQADPHLYQRAFLGAWLQNAFSMAYLNVTNVPNRTTGAKGFDYRNSEFGRRFPLYFPNGKTAGILSVRPKSLSIVTSWGDFLDGTGEWLNQSSYNNGTYKMSSWAPIYPNPFRVSSAHWSDINIACRNQGPGDLANISNIMSQCGLLYGTRRPRNNNSSSVSSPGSAWTLPMYSCASTTKAIIKTVAFRFNGTMDDLSGLKVVSITEKTYLNQESKPLWGVEKTSMRLADGGPLWGLVSPAKTDVLNLTTLRSESLYLPGRDPKLGTDNKPGADFAATALQMTYKTGLDQSYSSATVVDYTGAVNLAMYKKWQELSKTAETSAKILNLIWTDIAANMVVGTKGLQPHGGLNSKRDSSASTLVKPPLVISYRRRIKYNYVYGIPALLTLVLSVTAIICTVLSVLFFGATLSTMRTFLHHTSAGRFLTRQSQAGQLNQLAMPGRSEHSQSLHDDGYSDSPTSVWVNGAGQQQFTLGVKGWEKRAGAVWEFEDKKIGAGVRYARVRGEDADEGLEGQEISRS